MSSSFQIIIVLISGQVIMSSVATTTYYTVPCRMGQVKVVKKYWLHKPYTTNCEVIMKRSSISFSLPKILTNYLTVQQTKRDGNAQTENVSVTNSNEHFL